MLRSRLFDLEKTLQINKQIIGALVDATQSKDYKECLELFQRELRGMYGLIERLNKERDMLNGQMLIAEQIKGEVIDRERESQRVGEGVLRELKDSCERKEYSLQVAEKRIKEYEFILQEIATYDDYVASKLEELNIISPGNDTSTLFQ